jgi:hypothetical protein
MMPGACPCGQLHTEQHFPAPVCRFAEIKRLALDCKPPEVPATLARIVRICIDAEKSAANAASVTNGDNPSPTPEA